MDWLAVSAIVTAVTALGGLVIAVVTLWTQRKKDKAEMDSKLEKEKTDGEADRATTKEILDHASALRNMIEEKGKRIQALEKRVDSISKAIPQAQTADILAQKRAEMEREKLAMAKEREQWNKLVAVAKGIGWVLDRMKEDEEE